VVASPSPSPTPIGSPSVTITTRKLPTVEWPLQLKPPRIAITASFRPVPTSDEPTRHDGIDIAAPEGTAANSAADGVVTRAETGWNGRYGSIIVIDHGNDVSTWYAHLSEVSVAVGDQVRVGQKVGAVGSTGLSTGPHLHFELRLKRTPMDPLLALP
jgi:murein DD-endopeptidase MepM/ murein hydrolase activator NlpD